MKVNATAKIKDEAGNVVEERTGEVDYDFGENVADAAKNFGEDVVFSQFKQAAIISLQSVMRRAIQGGKTGKDLQEAVSAWKPGMKTITRKSPQEKVQEAFATMSAEDRKELLKQLKAQA